MKDYISVALKGAAMGAANVIPGVSGGTIAFITGIYETLINSLKSFDTTAIGLLLKFKIAEFANHVNLRFLIPLMLGVGVSILSLARLLKVLFASHAMLVWAFFFGLILASIFFVGKMVRRWSGGSIAFAILGVATAASFALVSPANENSSFVYLLLCGVVAISSMLIPGLSGSFVLILMGNYKLVMLDAVSDPFKNLMILIPVAIGAAVGMVVFSRVLSWVFKHYHDVAVGLITGFIAGSLVVIYPWKDPVMEPFQKGGELKEKIVGYNNWRMPDLTDATSWLAIGLIILGAVAVTLIERFGADQQSSA